MKSISNNVQYINGFGELQDIPPVKEKYYDYIINEHTTGLHSFGSVYGSGIRKVGPDFLLAMGLSNISNFDSNETHAKMSREELIILGKTLIKIAEAN